MGSLFSSPTKQATAAAQAQGGIDKGLIADYEAYTDKKQKELRDDIAAKSASNPYFDQAMQMDPSGYAVNPNDTVTYGSSGPGTEYAPSTTTVPQRPANNPRPKGPTQPPVKPPPPTPPPKPPPPTVTPPTGPGVTNPGTGRHEHLPNIGMRMEN